ncbi:MAG: hypothetical protein H6Q72_3978 [Firmicutes bacterium]|nr:hypothetical protein [Bacillota bacterium]
MNQQEQAKKWGQIVAKCWADEAFKARFKADPAAVFKEYGLVVPVGLKVVENLPEVNYIVLPAKPADLSDEQLDGVAGGILCYTRL